MTARAARRICSKEDKRNQYDVDFGHAPQCSRGVCPCEGYQEALVKPSRFARFWQMATFQKDTSAACVGCLQAAEVCHVCGNRKARQRMEAAIEALGGM